MSRAFFAPSLVVSEKPAGLLPKCGSCGLYKDCTSPKMPPAGKGRRKILIVGEAPSKADDERGQHLQGKAGRQLESQTR
jgi:uracil-DNA glycosylase family 4